MHLWHFDPKNREHIHVVAAGFGHSLLGPLLSFVFQQVRVSVAVWEHGAEWMPIHVEPSVMEFEIEHGKDRERNAYNAKNMRDVLRAKRAIRRAHAGFADLYVPIVARGQVVAVLVAGPFAEARPTSTAILERWRHLTGRQGHPADPEFASYLSTTLSTLVLESDQARTFERLLGCLARLMSGVGQADDLMNQAEQLRRELGPARFAERTWQAVRRVIDDRSQRTAFDEGLSNELRDLGLTRRADHVLVGLTVSRMQETDAVDEAIRRDAFQRGCSELARVKGEAVAGRVGDHGVVFLCGTVGSPTRKRRNALALAERASLLGNRSGLSLHFGATFARLSDPLSTSYQSALGAAESALVGDAKLVMAEPGSRRPHHSLRHLRQELSRVVEERPELLAARFDRYLEAVAAHCVYRLEPARAHLEVGFERMAEGLVKSGALDEKSFGVSGDRLDRAAGEARTVSDLFAAYRRAVVDLAAAVERPVQARRDRGLQGALDYLRRHYSEPLSRAKVARVAGFAPRYFSALFKKREMVTFEHYLRGLRIERAKQLLMDSSVDAARVAELSGFRSPQYFSRVFRLTTGATPLEFRRKMPKVSAQQAKKRSDDSVIEKALKYNHRGARLR